MKKLIYAFSALAFLLVSSCSGNEEHEYQSQGDLLKKMVYTGGNVSLEYRNYDFNFNYDQNNRLISIDKNGAAYREFTYYNELITEVRYYVFWNGNDESTLEYIIDFEYDSENRLIKATRSYALGGVGFEYIFNYINSSQADYIINCYTWSGDNNLYRSGTINFDSVTNNVLDFTQLNYGSYLNQDGSLNIYYPVHKIEFSYDSKKHPCSNIEGFKELVFFNLLNMDGNIFTSNFGATNNLISSKSYPINEPTNTLSPIWSYGYGDTFPSTAKKETIGDFYVHFYY